MMSLIDPRNQLERAPVLAHLPERQIGLTPLVAEIGDRVGAIEEDLHISFWRLPCISPCIGKHTTSHCLAWRIWVARQDMLL